MTRKNIKISESLFERLKADKGKHMSWPQYLEEQCLSDDTGDVSERLDRIEAAAKEATEAAQSAEASVEDLKP